jgi:hypothetical protein
MKSITTVLFFLALSANLWAQNDSIRYNTQPDLSYSTKDWLGMNFHIGVNYTLTEGAFKEFIATPIAINAALEVHDRNMFAFYVSVRPASLNKTFTHENRVWKADTSISLTTIQVLYGYQVWVSKRTALYLVGALGAHDLSVGGSNQNHNNHNSHCKNCPEKEKEWTIGSFAPSIGAFFDIRKRIFDPRWGYHDSYFRLKFMAYPTFFKNVGNGVLYDMGVGYSF